MKRSFYTPMGAARSSVFGGFTYTIAFVVNHEPPNSTKITIINQKNLLNSTVFVNFNSNVLGQLHKIGKSNLQFLDHFAPILEGEKIHIGL
jgi:hypothetical protein